MPRRVSDCSTVVSGLCTESMLDGVCTVQGLGGSPAPSSHKLTEQLRELQQSMDHNNAELITYPSRRGYRKRSVCLLFILL